MEFPLLQLETVQDVRDLGADAIKALFNKLSKEAHNNGDFDIDMDDLKSERDDALALTQDGTLTNQAIEELNGYGKAAISIDNAVESLRNRFEQLSDDAQEVLLKGKPKVLEADYGINPKSLQRVLGDERREYKKCIQARAVELVEQGATPQEAAQKTGITEKSVSKLITKSLPAPVEPTLEEALNNPLIAAVEKVMSEHSVDEISELSNKDVIKLLEVGLETIDTGKGERKISQESVVPAAVKPQEEKNEPQESAQPETGFLNLDRVINDIEAMLEYTDITTLLHAIELKGDASCGF